MNEVSMAKVSVFSGTKSDFPIWWTKLNGTQSNYGNKRGSAKLVLSVDNFGNQIIGVWCLQWISFI